MLSFQHPQDAHAKEKENASKQKSAAPAQPLAISLSRNPVAAQAETQVSQPFDKDEVEADSVANRVMRMPEPEKRSPCACGGGCPRCQSAKPARARLQKKSLHAHDAGQAAAAPVAPVAQELLSSSGRPLDSATREFMEPRFEQDFSQVRVHADGQAALSAEAVQARAYTVGRDVVFGAGEYAPATTEGKRLIAHELAHVVQQRSRGSHVKRRIQRSPRALPTRVGASNFMLTGGGSQIGARTTSFALGYRPSGQISAIVGEGMTLRGLARMLLPIYVRAAAAPGAVAAPTEDELAQALFDYNRFFLSPPAMTPFRAGMRLPLPVELDVNPGPVTHTRNDWLLDPDNVRLHAANLSPAEIALVDQPATAAAPPPTNADVTALTSSVSGAQWQGSALFVRATLNPFEGAPLATMALASMNATDRFDAAMGFMLQAVNRDITMLESLAPGFTLLQALRAALTAPPANLPPARERDRVSRVGMLPQDPAIAGVSPEFLSSGSPGGSLDRPDVIYFRRGRSSIDDSEIAKFTALRAAHPNPVTLIGSTSEEEDPAIANERLRVVELMLRGGTAVVDTLRVAATSAGTRPSVGSLAYAQMRSVRIDPNPPPFEPDCHTVASTSEPCQPNHAAVETQFIAAHTRALAIIDEARTRLSARTDAGRDAAIRRRFGVASLANMRTRLDMLRGTVQASLNSHECGTNCDAACNSGSLAYSGGPGATPLMVICDGVLSSDLEYAASVIIHESSHATQGMRQANPRAPGHPADWAYRWERMSGTITEMSPNPNLSNASLDNADSYTQFVMDLRDPALIPAGSQPIDEAPADQFQGTWATTHRDRVRHGLANAQKWFIWAGQYLANAYDSARTGSADTTYTSVSTRFGALAIPPDDTARAKLAGLQYTVRAVGQYLKLAMRIEHAPPGDPTSFGAASPLLLLVGDDATSIVSDRTRGELFVRKLIEGAPEVEAGRRAAYSGLVIDIRNQYEIDHP
ncbi:MAG: DUF4157 domain-containing protein [Acidobacteria bacterium]|nr:DUF4157 domain-containing protein [Acidobacteriota bacterium]